VHGLGIGDLDGDGRLDVITHTDTGARRRISIISVPFTSLDLALIAPRCTFST